MKIGGFTPNSSIDYPGLLSAVVFTKGCNFNCSFCHNVDLVKETPADIPEREVLKKIKERSKIIDGVVISGGEPLIQRGIISFIKEIKDIGLKVKLDTNGYKADILEKLVLDELVDYVAMDLKAPYSKYIDTCGGARINVTRIYWAVGTLLGSPDNIDYEFRTTVLPDFTEDDIRDLGSMVRGAKKYALQAFRNERTLDPTWQKKPSVTEEALKQFKLVMEEYVKVVEIRI